MKVTEKKVISWILAATILIIGFTGFHKLCTEIFTDGVQMIPSLVKIFWPYYAILGVATILFFRSKYIAKFSMLGNILGFCWLSIAPYLVLGLLASFGYWQWTIILVIAVAIGGLGRWYYLDYKHVNEVKI